MKKIGLIAGFFVLLFSASSIQGHLVSTRTEWVSYATIQGGVQDLAISPDGKILAAADASGKIRLYNLPNGTYNNTFYAHDYFTMRLDFSSEGLLATTGRDGKNEIWNISTRIKVWENPIINSWADCISFSPDDRYFLSGEGCNPTWNPGACSERFGNLTIWDLENDNIIYNITGFSRTPNDIQFSPTNSDVFACAEANTISFWDITTGELIKSMQTGDEGKLHSVNYSPDGKILASASWDESVKIWNISTTDLITTLEHEFSPWAVAFSPDGKLLATSEGKRNTYEDQTFPIHDPTIRIYDTTTFEVVQKLKGHKTAIVRVIFSPAGTFNPPILASGDIIGEIRLWKQQEIEKAGNGVTGFDLFSGVTLCVAISLVIKQSNRKKKGIIYNNRKN